MSAPSSRLLASRRLANKSCRSVFMDARRSWTISFIYTWPNVSSWAPHILYDRTRNSWNARSIFRSEEDSLITKLGRTTLKGIPTDTVCSASLNVILCPVGMIVSSTHEILRPNPSWKPVSIEMVCNWMSNTRCPNHEKCKLSLKL